MDIQEIALRFSDIKSYEGQTFECQLLPGEIEVLQVVAEGREEIPIFLSVTDDQILCIAHIFHDEEIMPEKRAELLETMVEMNIPMPLSSFSKVGDRFVVFGALSVSSSFDDILHEVVVLGENALEAIEALSEFLR